MKKISLLSFLFSFCFFFSLFVVSVQGRVHKHKDKRSPVGETAAIKSAWDSACQFDSGPSATLLIPQGHTFMMQSAIFNGLCQNKVIFQVDGILMAPDGPESWLTSNSKIQWLVFYRMNGFTIQGSGVIDGRGQKWWDLPCKPHKAIRIFMCTDVALKKGLKILNSPNSTSNSTIAMYLDNGVRIKTYQGGIGSVSGITFNNIHMDTVRNPLIIDQYYCEAHGCRTYDYRFPPMHFGCSDSVPCTNLTLSDIELLPSEGEYVRDPFCWNAYGASQTLTIPPVFCLQEGVPRSILENDLLGQC
ncbi:hypothetical protein MKW92_044126 [Papaver armeniacum]|nr:hypothetical protein MKW92_044126 [Papaver armeniacum]